MLKDVCVVMFWWSDAGIATRSYVTLYIITRLSDPTSLEPYQSSVDCSFEIWDCTPLDSGSRGRGPYPLPKKKIAQLWRVNLLLCLNQTKSC